MKAVLCKTHGTPDTLVYEDTPDPVAGKGEVVVDVYAAAVNFPDTLIIQNKYQFKPALPFSPGGEAAGVISAVGEGVTGYKVGDPVIAMSGWGAFAEKVVLKASKVSPIPPGVPMEAAASLMMTYGTTHYALKERAELKPGETLLVLGAAGGTGLSAVELGKLMGARVIAAASSEEKLALCREHGADETINYATEDLKERVKALTGGKGVDVVYDPVGGQYTEPALRSMAWKGRFLVIGFTTGDIPKPPLNLVLLKGCSIVGVFWGAFTETEPKRNQELLQELLGFLQSGQIRPTITARHPLSHAAKALQDVADRKALGKIVLLTEKGQAAG